MVMMVSINQPASPDALDAVRDPSRLAALRRTTLLDSPTDQAFDRLTQLATKIFHVPISLVTLVDGDRQFFKSCTGLPEPWASRRGTPLTHSFCQYTVATNEPLVVEDAREHPLLFDNLAIPDLGVIAYAGIPLVTSEGNVLGSFCVIDDRPRRWTPDEIGILRELATSVVTEIELLAANAAAEQWASELERERQARKALLEHSKSVAALLETLVNEIPQIVWTFKGDGTVDYFNRRWYEYVGCNEAEMDRGRWREFVHPEDRPRISERSKHRIATGTPYRIELRLRRYDGVYRWHMIQVVPLQADDGQVLAWYGAATDIDDRKRAEEDLRFLAEASNILGESLDVETTLPHVAQLAVPQLADWCAVDLVSKDGTVRRVAVAQRDSDNSAFGPTLQQVFPVYSSELADEATVTRMREPKLVSDLSVPAIEGPCHDALHALGVQGYMLVPLLIRGQALGRITLVAASNRRYGPPDLALATNLAYRAALAVDNGMLYREARTAIHEREALLSVASHELKNPLTTLLGNAQLLQRRAAVGTKITERELRSICQIHDQGTRLNKLLDGLLDIARLETGQLSIERVPVDFTALVMRVATEVDATLIIHTLIRDVPNAPLHVLGDELRLEQVIRNLLGNAIKYSPDGGQVTLRVTRLVEQVQLVVQDTGIGIPRSALPHLFGRFVRIKNHEAEQIRGLGLGLYVVKEIVTLHGGTVEVSSVEGQGSTFTVNLPLHSP